MNTANCSEALRSTPAATTAAPYEVSVVGRWAELDARAAGRVRRLHARPPAPAPLTPMAGQRCEFELEDADGRRRVVLAGGGAGASLRGRQRARPATSGSTPSTPAAAMPSSGSTTAPGGSADAGSTNGIRVESAGGAHGPRLFSHRGRRTTARPGRGARIVLSARAEGPASEYPWVALRLPPHAATRITPIAASSVAVPKTPLTAILAAPPAELAFTLTAASGSGLRTLELRASALPVSVGRSRNQTLVIDRRHEGVSGHHLDIIDLDDDGRQVEVHGDNGVLLDGVHHGPGARLHWMPGQTLVLGGSPHDVPTCQLTLAAEQRSDMHRPPSSCRRT